jgi:alpha-glucosidase
LCLDVYNRSTAPNTGLELWDCTVGDPGQQWKLGDFSTIISGLQTNLVMSAGYPQGTQVVSTPFAFGVNQQWTFDAVEILALGDRCLDVVGGSPSPGALAQLHGCQGTTNEQWTFNQYNDSAIHGIGDQLCVGETGTTAGSSIDMESCTGAQNQQWQLNPGGAFVNSQSGLCLDVPGWNLIDGTHLDIAACTGSTNQKFATDGLIEEASTDLCLDVYNASFADGTAVITWPCNANDKAQPWYFAP